MWGLLRVLWGSVTLNSKLPPPRQSLAIETSVDLTNAMTSLPTTN